MNVKNLCLSLFMLMLTTNVFAQVATLTWNPNSESDLAGYNIYFGTTSGVYGEPIDVSLTGTPLTPKEDVDVGAIECGENKTVFFAVTAYDLGGHESDFSIEISKTYDVAPCSPDGLAEILAELKEIKKMLRNAKVELTFPAGN